jgi:hypothetical protein
MPSKTRGGLSARELAKKQAKTYLKKAGQTVYGTRLTGRKPVPDLTKLRKRKIITSLD